MMLEKRYAFPKDSSLKILTSGLLGEQYIGIEAGSGEENLVAMTPLAPPSLPLCWRT